MCKGLAIIMDKKSHILTAGLSSHTKTCKKFKVKEDDCLKFEVIVTDKNKQGYEVTIDDSYKKNSNNGKEAKTVLLAIKEWIKQNELLILRQLLFCYSFSKHRNNQDMSYCKAGNDQFMSYCKARNDQYMIFCESGNNQDISYCKAGNDQFMSYCKAENDQDMSHCKAGRYRFIAYMTCGDQKSNDFIKKLSDNNPKLKWRDLVHLAIKGYETKQKVIYDGT